MPNGGTPAASFEFRASAGIPAPVRARIRKLEDAIATLRLEMTAVAGDVVAMASGFARTDDRVFVQHTITAKIHRAKVNDDGCTLCGWPYLSARRKGPGKLYRFVNNLVNIPGTMMCEHCLPTERAVAMGVHSADLSGDELEPSDNDVQDT